jgi:type IV pilus assembly protein PilW
MMVALVIASLLLVALTVLFINTSAARTETDRASRQIEAGRFALAELADDIRHAGYYGPIINAPTYASGTLPDPCSQVVTDISTNLGLPVQGYVGGATAPVSCLNAKAGYKPNTGVLVVRRADTFVTAPAASPTSGYYQIQTSGCEGDTTAYVVDTDTNTSPYTLHTNASPGCTPITNAPIATVSPLYTRIYFISNCSNDDCTASGADNVPTLKRLDVTPSATLSTCDPPTRCTIKSIVDGIENLQFDYGLDTTAAPGDGSPDVYTNTPTTYPGLVPATTAEWKNVMAVRIYLLARNIDSSGVVDTKTYHMGPVGGVTPGGAYRRHAYTEAVRLINPSERRE